MKKGARRGLEISQYSRAHKFKRVCSQLQVDRLYVNREVGGRSVSREAAVCRGFDRSSKEVRRPREGQDRVVWL
jgi:hypothetical protein